MSDDFTTDCQNCGGEVDSEEYDRTGTDEYCDQCDLPCCDPRGHTFGNCGCSDDSTT